MGWKECSEVGNAHFGPGFHHFDVVSNMELKWKIATVRYSASLREPE